MQLALAPVPVSVHVPLKVPVLLLENVTVPVGVIGVLFVSVTVAVQRVELLTTTLAGLHVTVVMVRSPIDTVASSLVAR
jgi:hypothetical protein